MRFPWLNENPPPAHRLGKKNTLGGVGEPEWSKMTSGKPPKGPPNPQMSPPDPPNASRDPPNESPRTPRSDLGDPKRDPGGTQGRLGDNCFPKLRNSMIFQNHDFLEKDKKETKTWFKPSLDPSFCRRSHPST